MSKPRGTAQIIAWSLAGIALGVLAGLLEYAIVWALHDPEGGVSGGFASLRHVNWTTGPSAGLLLGGATAGFLILGSWAGNRLARGVARGLARGLKLAVGVFLGGAVGALAYLLLYVATNPGESLPASIARMDELFGQRDDPFTIFVTLGGLAGMTLAVYLLGGQPLRWLTRAAVGCVVGSIAGLVVYSVGYVVLNHPGVPNSADYVFYFAEAFYAFSPAEFLLVGAGATVGILMAKYSWRLYGLLTFLSLICVVGGYLWFTFSSTLPSVPPERRTLSYLLVAAETATLVLVLLYSFYTLDVATRKHWRRTPREAVFSRYFMPRVAIQLPVYNEPPELVLATLRKLLALDYPVDLFRVMVLDDSTRPECSQPLEEFCKRHQKEYNIEYHHRPNRSGYKAGALNYALERTPANVELIAVVDADYQVEPEFLRETVGFFVDAKLGWLQTPQDYRNRDQSFLTEQYYLADSYFYRTVLPSRNEENSIIFCGTMGILRRQALKGVGGWGEDYITEDAELSLRLLDARWRSLYVNKTYGRGLIPATFEGYKKQHNRWAFGGGKILRGHFLDLLFGRFTLRQRFDYFVGLINWIEGAFILAIALIVLTMGLGEVFGFNVATHHESEILMLGLVPWFLLMDGLTRVHMVLRRSVDLTFAGTLRVLGMWFSVKFSNMFAAFKALLGFHVPFMRTKKVAPEKMTRRAALAQSLRLAWFECILAVGMLGTAVAVTLHVFLGAEPEGGIAVTRFLLILWLLYYALVFAAAPSYAYKSYRTFRPDVAPALVSPAPPITSSLARRLVQ